MACPQSGLCGTCCANLFSSLASKSNDRFEAEIVRGHDLSRRVLDEMKKFSLLTRLRADSSFEGENEAFSTDEYLLKRITPYDNARGHLLRQQFRLPAGVRLSCPSQGTLDHHPRGAQGNPLPRWGDLERSGSRAEPPLNETMMPSRKRNRRGLFCPLISLGGSTTLRDLMSGTRIFVNTTESGW